jgi:hypothetical protein
MAASSASTLSTIIDELDRAITEQGLVASQVEIGSDESSILDLRSHLQQQLNEHGDVDMDQIKLTWAGAPLPTWVPRIISDTMGLTRSLTASEALAKAISKPRAVEITSEFYHRQGIVCSVS